ncbi:hypothetical protein [Pseudomonas phage BHU-1]|nr:hypothetical protein [Pseudomonas phage BHU-1]UGV19997.1 hypothetical protein [Pseudomonas phage Pa BHU-15]UIW13569.1 hypothetical protein [Pseudomonas phage Pa BHU-17]
MPVFANDSELHEFYGPDIRFVNLRLPQAFDQWIEGRQALAKDNPGMPALVAADHDIGLLLDLEANVLGYVAWAGKRWYTSLHAQPIRPSPSVLVSAAVCKANASL